MGGFRITEIDTLVKVESSGEPLLPSLPSLPSLRVSPAISRNCNRHSQFKTSALAILCRHQSRGAASFLHPLANDCQTQTGTPLLGGKKRFPNEFANFRSHSRPAIANSNHCLTRSHGCLNLNVATMRRSLHRIQKEIRQHVTNGRRSYTVDFFISRY